MSGKKPIKTGSGPPTPKVASMGDMTKTVWRITPGGVVEYLAPDRVVKSLTVTRASAVSGSQLAVCDAVGRWSRFSMKNLNFNLQGAVSTPCASIVTNPATTAGKLRGKKFYTLINLIDDAYQFYTLINLIDDANQFYTLINLIDGVLIVSFSSL